MGGNGGRGGEDEGSNLPSQHGMVLGQAIATKKECQTPPKKNKDTLVVFHLGLEENRLH